LTVQAAEHADEAGIDELWLGDEGPAREPFALLAAAAVRTQRLRLGVAVTNPYVRHAVITATSAMTVQELSGGRFTLGIGPGGNVALGPLGIERVKPLTETRRAVRLIRATVDGVATEGFSPPTHPFVSASLPIYIGARGEKFNRFASESADGVFLGGIPASVLPDTVSWARSVRPINVSIYINALADESELEAVRPRLIYAFLDAPDLIRERSGIRLEDAREAAVALGAGDTEPAARLVTDDLLDQLVLHGGARRISERLAAIARAFGPTSVGLALLSPDPVAGIDLAAAVSIELRKELS
jgi:5,10-methylenetetrahydromethanopterin reductase